MALVTPDLMTNPMSQHTTELSDGPAATTATFEGLGQGDSDTNTPQWAIILQAVSLAVITVLAGALNAVVIHTIRKRIYLQTPSNRFIYSMTISNAVMTFVVLPFNFTSVIIGEWIFGVVMCNLMGFITLCTLTGTIFSIALITLDRYYAIVQPMLYPLKMTSNYTSHLVVSIWILALICTLPPSFGWSRYTYRPAKAACMTEWHHHVSFSGFFAVSSTLFPFFLICYCYVGILKVARQSSRRVSHGNVVVEEAIKIMSRRRSRRTSLLVNIRMNSPTKALRTVLITVGALMLTWFPFFAELLCEAVLGDYHVADWFEAGAVWLAYCSLILNPVIYALWNKTVRNEILGMFCTRSVSLQWAWRDDDKILARRRESRRLSISGSITDLSYTTVLKGKLTNSTLVTTTGQQTSSNGSVVSGVPLASIHEIGSNRATSPPPSSKKSRSNSGQQKISKATTSRVQQVGSITADVHRSEKSSVRRSARLLSGRKDALEVKGEVDSGRSSHRKLSIVSVDENSTS
ncbi:G-protein coupled receptor 161-like [Diadema antillarum]|uniref:G-protein coupled receptor 161-like n=1 Tax=Diadema antillarum TaxID=105358 RepID=UPI003A89F31B